MTIWGGTKPRGSAHVYCCRAMQLGKSTSSNTVRWTTNSKHPARLIGSPVYSPPPYIPLPLLSVNYLQPYPPVSTFADHYGPQSKDRQRVCICAETRS